MPKVYSLDLRKKVFSAWQAGEGSQRELAKRFNVSLSFIRDLSRRYRETGTIEPKPQGGDRRSKLQEKEQKIVKKIVESKNDIYLREIQNIIQNQTGIVVSVSSLCRTLQKQQLRRKKTLVASEQNSERVKKLRQEWRIWLETIDIRNLIFIDETGFNLAMNRLYGRSLKGERVNDERPGNKGKNVTMVGAMSDSGLMATMTLPGGLDTASFLVYVEKILLPTLWVGAIIVMDNLPVHYASKVKALIESVGAKVKFLPPYSPDLSPIELCWSKIKEILRSAKARTENALNVAITYAINAISSDDAINWFHHCGLFAESIR